jgi:MipA family protein
MRRCLLLLLLPWNALAQDDGPRLRYLLGVEASAGPSAWGQSDWRLGVKPMAALRYGRLRLSNSGAGALLDLGDAGGASAELVERRNWRLSAGLRLDRGRKASSSDAYAELPEVPATVRGRVSLRWQPPGTYSLQAAWLPDLRGRGLGSFWTLNAGRSLDWTAWDARWSAYASLTGGSRSYLQAHFGTPAGPRYPLYEPGPGLRDLRLGLALQKPLSADGRWLLFGQASASQLLGPAARAPFVRQRLAQGLALGVAYRN